MSATVAKALHFTFGDDAEQTACFVEKVDKFFDCFNVSTFTQGKFSRKVFRCHTEGRTYAQLVQNFEGHKSHRYYKYSKFNFKDHVCSSEF